MPKLINEVGNKYGRLTVLYRTNTPKKGVYWHCKCDCGQEVDVYGTALRNGNTKSCGCLKHERIIESNMRRGKKIYIGDKFGSLTVKKIEPLNIYCQCDCGNERWVSRQNLLSGDTKTCGCGIGFVNANYINEIGNRYGKLVVIEEAGRNKDGRVLWKSLCDCGNYKITLGKSLRAGLTQSCGCIHSFGEQKINQLLTKMNIKFIPQKSFEDLQSNSNHPLFFDFYLPNYNILIEYQGEQHYKHKNQGWNNEKNFLKTKEHDELKREYCKRHNIQLIEIPYTDFDLIDINYLKQKCHLSEVANENINN